MMYKRVWTLDEDEYIKKNIENKTLKEMAEYLKCAIATVKNRARFLGFEIDDRTRKIWTDDEIELLKVMAPKYLNKTIAKKLNRSINELNKKARTLGIKLIFKRPIWKKWKIKYLKENINVLSLARIMEHLEVNYYQITDKIAELGLQLNDYHWTNEEVNILKELVGKVYIGELVKVLNRSEGAIRTKAKNLGLDSVMIKRVYTEEELQYIKDNWGIISICEMARKLGISRVMVRKQADKMELGKLGNNPYRKWGDAEISALKELATKKTITELAKYFKTTNEAIISVAYREEINLKDSKIHWTEEDNKRLMELAKTLDLSEIAREMKRNKAAVRMQAERKNIKIMPDKNIVNSVWTEENSKELQVLVLENKSLLEICKLMNKKDAVVLKKAKELNLEIKREKVREWTDEEVIKLKELAKTKKLSEIVRELNRTSNSVKEKAKRLGIEVIVDKRNWTKEEYVLLEKLVMVEKKTPQEIANILGRTEDAIIIKINRRGLQIQTNDKKFWTKEEEVLLTDLWGTSSYEEISKKLNRTVSSIRNKATMLGLGSVMGSNYNGLTLQNISDLFNININTVSVAWIGLGLKYKVQKISKVASYRYVEIKDLYEFLKNNQNIWDSRYLEKNILGVEPDWLKEKRKLDKEQNPNNIRLDLTKQQLILAKKFFLELKEELIEPELKLVKK